MKDGYPEYYRHLKGLIRKLGKELPGPTRGFAELHKAAVGEGVLAPKTKELIAFGIATMSGCDGCIAYHAHDAIRAGATREELVEAIGVALMMGGGPTLMYGAEALRAVDEFSSELRSAA